MVQHLLDHINGALARRYLSAEVSLEHTFVCIDYPGWSVLLDSLEELRCEVRATTLGLARFL